MSYNNMNQSCSLFWNSSEKENLSLQSYSTSSVNKNKICVGAAEELKQKFYNDKRSFGNKQYNMQMNNII